MRKCGRIRYAKVRSNSAERAIDNGSNGWFARPSIQCLPVPLMMENVEIVVEDEPTVEQRGEGEDGPFGLYEGIPHEDRGSSTT